MKTAITDIYNILKNDARLNTDGVETIKVKSFCKYEDPLIPDYPSISLKRISKSKKIKTMPSGYVESLYIDIIVDCQELELGADSATPAGFDKLDMLTGIIEKILQESPKINGNYLDSEISDTKYAAASEGNYIFFRAEISLMVKRFVRL